MPIKMLRIGVMGYSSQKFNVEEARRLISKSFDELSKECQDCEISVVSGYTKLGIPALAYEEAVRRGWGTVGVACEKANDYEVFPCDEIYIVGKNWGDESPFFLNKCHVFVRIGGGKQSHREAEQAKAMGKQVFEYELEALL